MIMLVLLLVLVIRGYRRPLKEEVAVLLATIVSTMAYLVPESADAQHFPAAVSFTIFFCGLLNPVFIWLMCCYLCLENFRLQWRTSGIAAAYAIAASLAAYGALDNGTSIDRIPSMALGVFQASFAVHAFYLIGRGVTDDLIEERRSGRLFMVPILASYILLGAASAIIFAGKDKPGSLEVGLTAIIAVTAFRLLVWLLKAKADLILVAQPSDLGDGPINISATSSSMDKADNALLKKLIRLMSDQRQYLQPDLKVADVAGSLGIPEHKLRSLINTELSYRNFKTFLNHYRIQDARERLADDDQAQTSIAELARNVGYRSVGPFNRAFKEFTDTTPSQYRKVLRSTD